MCRVKNQKSSDFSRHILFLGICSRSKRVSNPLLSRSTFFFSLFLSLLSVQCSLANSLPIIVSGEDDSGVPKKWNSHIDNQAYLERKRQQRSRQTPAISPIIRIEREGRFPTDRARHRGENSWEIEYHTPGYSLIYRENYRPNELPTTFIRPLPKKKKSRQSTKHPQQMPRTP